MASSRCRVALRVLAGAGAVIAIGLAAGDLVVRGGAVDLVMIGCAVIALGMMAHHRWPRRIGDSGIIERE